MDADAVATIDACADTLLPQLAIDSDARAVALADVVWIRRAQRGDSGMSDSHACVPIGRTRMMTQLLKLHEHFGVSGAAATLLVPAWTRLLNRFRRDEARWFAVWLAVYERRLLTHEVRPCLLPDS